MTGQQTHICQGQQDFPSEDQLRAFANQFASVLEAPLVIWLEGDLGAGKTSFARAMIHSLGYEGGVKSPTYGLLEHYELSAFEVLHLDLYRIGDPGELEFLGIEDLINKNSIVLVEWPERGGDVLPSPDFIFRFAYAGSGRELHWFAHSSMAEKVASRFINT